MIKINIHAGHNPSGKIACGAVGLLNESDENRVIKNKVVRMLKANGHEVIDCTCEDGNSTTDVLYKIVNKCNENIVDIDVSIHFNAGRFDKNGDGYIGGVECYVYSFAGEKYNIAKRICSNISKLGFTNRGIKESKNLYVLRKTINPAVLLEVCFVDDKDDVDLYKGIDKEIIAKNIAEAITNSNIENEYTIFVKNVQSVCGAKVDGIAGTETLSKTVTVSKSINNRHAVVSSLQAYLNYLGYNCGEIDGIAGNLFDAAVKKYQSDNGCVVDGELTKGQKTWKTLLKIN